MHGGDRDGLLVAQPIGYRGHGHYTARCVHVHRLRPRLLWDRARLAALFGLPLDAVGLKARTNEGCDAVGEKRAIQAQAAVLLGGRAHHLAQALGYNALACDIRGAASCGDDTLDSGEACDDGNLESGDGCDLACRIEATP